MITRQRASQLFYSFFKRREICAYMKIKNKKSIERERLLKGHW
jgi:hypothetical protein